MTYVKINNTLYPAAINGKLSDHSWDDRDVKTIRLAMDVNTASSLFVDDVHWSIVDEYLDENAQTQSVEYDNSEYCVAGDIIDHRNGMISVKMGRATEKEIIDILMGGAV